LAGTVAELPVQREGRAEASDGGPVPALAALDHADALQGAGLPELVTDLPEQGQGLLSVLRRPLRALAFLVGPTLRGRR
jgi:hypothetical protein